MTPPPGPNRKPNEAVTRLTLELAARDQEIAAYTAQMVRDQRRVRELTTALKEALTCILLDNGNPETDDYRRWITILNNSQENTR